MIQNKSFIIIGFLNQLPQFILMVMSVFEAQYKNNSYNIK